MMTQERLTAYTEEEESMQYDTYYCLRCRIRYVRDTTTNCPVCRRMAVINLSRDREVPCTRSYRKERQLKLLVEKDGQLFNS